MDREVSQKDLKIRRNAFIRLLELIDGANQEIEISNELSSTLMARQAKYLKQQYVEELMTLLKEYEIPLKLEAV